MAQIFRDALGIPHVRATGIADLAAGQGEVTARDRAWQLETDLRRAEGRLAELLGPAGVASDVFARRARLGGTARRAFAAADPATRDLLADYARGVRAGMAEGRSRATEFAALDELFVAATGPLEWEDHSPLSVLHGTHALFSTFPLVLWRAHVRDRLGDEWVEALAGYPDTPDESGSGSNAWAIHGSLTGSGAPILAGDPHRTLGLPGVYQQVRLACDEFDVVGLAFPGVPGVAHFGHTGHAAWGITNAIAHSADVFRERLRRRDGAVEALGPDGWVAADVERTVIAVRDGEPVGVEAIETERGTVVTDLSEHPDGDLLGWSVRFPARELSDLGASSLLPLMRARTAEDVVAAYARWVDPVNRVLAADTRGDVRSVTAGRFPDRPVSDRRLPLDGARVAPAPVAAPPPAIVVESVAVDANERPRRESIAQGWAYPSRHRADRIGELLADLSPREVGDLAAVWGDTRSGTAIALRPLLESARTAGAAEALRGELLAWDGAMDAASVTAGRFAAWQRALALRTTEHPLLRPLAGTHAFGAVYDPWMSPAANVAASLLRVLTDTPLREDAVALTIAALEDAAAHDSPWGLAHRLQPVHVLALVPGADDPGAALSPFVSGAGDTVRCTGGSLGITTRAWRGSVARWAWDLADRDRSVWSVPFGASGVPGSPHFDDQLPGWLDVEPAPVVTDWARLVRDRDTA